MPKWPFSFILCKSSTPTASVCSEASTHSLGTCNFTLKYILTLYVYKSYMYACMLVDFRDSEARAQTSRWRSTSMACVRRSYTRPLAYTRTCGTSPPLAHGYSLLLTARLLCRHSQKSQNFNPKSRHGEGNASRVFWVFSSLARKIGRISQNCVQN